VNKRISHKDIKREKKTYIHQEQEREKERERERERKREREKYGSLHLTDHISVYFKGDFIIRHLVDIIERERELKSLPRENCFHVW